MSQVIQSQIAKHLSKNGETCSLETDGDFPVDRGVLEQFPTGSRILSANRFRASAWTAIARLSVELPTGDLQSFFLKCAVGSTGHLMMEGEFNAMTEIYKTMPDFVPKPVAWGKYHHQQQQQDTWFFLSEFVDMREIVPDPNQLCLKLTQLHRTSVSPTGKFGFHVTTCQGSTPQNISWESSWAVFFSKLLAHVLNLDNKTNGIWRDLDTLSHRIVTLVIPRLIGALEAEGRSVKPCLIHADLWEGNTGTEYGTGNIRVFDSAAFYAHNETEIGDWRCHYNKINNKIYIRTYLRHFPISEPREEWDDRNRMYSIYYNIIYSVNHKDQGTAVRQTAYDDMFYLIDKYAPFDAGTEPPRILNSARATLSDERDHAKQ